ISSAPDFTQADKSPRESPRERERENCMNAQTAARRASAPQTPPLPSAKPEAIGLSPPRLQKLSDAFKREVDKGTLPGATVMVARKGQIGWVDAIRRPGPGPPPAMGQ